MHQSKQNKMETSNNDLPEKLKNKNNSEIEIDPTVLETIYSELLLKENFINFKKSERVYLEKIKNATE